MKSSGHTQSLHIQILDKRELLSDFSFTTAGELVPCLVHEHEQFDWTVVAGGSESERVKAAQTTMVVSAWVRVRMGEW